MRTTTIKGKIFKFNLIIITFLIILVAFAFNISIRIYIEKETLTQLYSIAYRAKEAVIKHPVKAPRENQHNKLFKSYYQLNRSLKEPLSFLNADFALVDNNMNIISLYEDYILESVDIKNKIVNKIFSVKKQSGQDNFTFKYTDNTYAAVMLPIKNQNTLDIGWIIIYSSLEKVNQFQRAINGILLIILIIIALIVTIFSSFISKKISTPISAICEHIRNLSDRKFNKKIDIPADNEILELVNNINIMSHKLESYDHAQKTFLQNVSHEFRTPLMTIQSYAEGLKYGVVDNNSDAVDIIISESKRITKLVEDILYLSRLEAIDEVYHFSILDLNELLNDCVDRMSQIAKGRNISIDLCLQNTKLEMQADGDKLIRAIINILSNCIRYAKTKVEVQSEYKDNTIIISIVDDGSGFDLADIPHLSERFYKGKNGAFGLGLAITKSIIDKHGGQITASNNGKGANFTIILPKPKK